MPEPEQRRHAVSIVNLDAASSVFPAKYNKLSIVCFTVKKIYLQKIVKLWPAFCYPLFAKKIRQ
jgi:hypothetical protein